MAGPLKLLQERIDNSGQLQEFTKEPRTTFKELQTSLFLLKVRVHDSTVGKKIIRLSKNGIHGRAPRRKPQLTEHNTKSHLTFGKYSVDKG